MTPEQINYDEGTEQVCITFVDEHNNQVLELTLFDDDAYKLQEMIRNAIKKKFTFRRY